MGRDRHAVGAFAACLCLLAACGDDAGKTAGEATAYESAVSVSGPAGRSATGLDDLDGYIEEAMAEWQIPGLAIAVVHDDEVTYLRGFGVREAGKPDTVDADTVFALSSNGKAFTAATVAALVDDGKLSWDDRVVQHLGDFRLADSWVTEQVTLRDLLSHRVAGDLGIGKLELWAFTDLTRKEVIDGLRYLEPGPVRFRGRFEYSNPNISAAGMAAAAVAGSSWDEAVKRRLLDPIGMSSATTTVYDLWDAGDVAVCYMCDLDHTPGWEDAKIDNIAMPHIVADGGLKPIPWRSVDNIAPAGSINLNVSDLAKWVRVHLSGGMLDGRRIMSEAVVDEMHRPQMVVSQMPYSDMPGFGHVLAYGLGWYVTDYHGRKMLMHTGAITGWRSGIAMLPEERLGVAVLSNQHSPSVPNTLALALAFVAFDRVLDLPRQDWSADWHAMARQSMQAASSAEERLAAARREDTEPSVAPTRLAGTYRHPAFGDLVLDPESGTARLAGVMAGRLVHWQDDRYRVTWLGPTPISYFLTYTPDADGPVTEVDLHGFGTFARRAE